MCISANLQEVLECLCNSVGHLQKGDIRAAAMTISKMQEWSLSEEQWAELRREFKGIYGTNLQELIDSFDCIWYLTSSLKLREEV